MKTARVSLLLFSVMAAAIASAQVQFVFLEKRVDYTQTSASAPSVASGTPYSFHYAVNGLGASSLAGYGPVYIATGVIGNGLSTPALVASSQASYSSSEDTWEMTPFAYADAATLNTVFLNGVYGVRLNATTISITLGGGAGPYTDGYPAAAPMLTGLSAGDFDGSGNLKINLGLSNYTFTLNGLPGYSSGGHVGIFINGVNDPGFITVANPSGKVQAESINFGAATDPELTFLTFNPSASNMVAGNTYTLEMEYNLAPNAASNLLGMGELDLGLFTYRTSLTLIAVPEPSTYVAIFGAVAMAVMLVRRRRHTAA